MLAVKPDSVNELNCGLELVCNACEVVIVEPLYTKFVPSILVVKAPAENDKPLPYEPLVRTLLAFAYTGVLAVKPDSVNDEKVGLELVCNA